MLPSIFNKSALLTKARITKSPLFEILLFDKKLRFRLPKITAKQKKGLLFKEDLRPFVNTVSKQNYLKEDSMGYYVSHIYSGGWNLYPKKIFATPNAQLVFSLACYSPTKKQEKDFSDFMLKNNAKAWIQHYYSITNAFFNSFYLHKHENGLVEFVDEPNKTGLTETKPISLTPLSINGLIAFRALEGPSCISYWMPFAKADILSFEFSVKPLTKLDSEATQQVLAQCEEVANTIMSTVSIDFSNNKNLDDKVKDLE